jgi:hypothetical protein
MFIYVISIVDCAIRIPQNAYEIVGRLGNPSGADLRAHDDGYKATIDFLM